jgi:large subunit ribosomal protein L13
MQTTFTKQETVVPTWYHVSAKGQVLGRLAGRISKVLMGKHKVTWTPHVEDGDAVVVTDAELIEVTRGKTEKKVYRFHTGFAGGLKEVPFVRLRERNPEQLLMLAIKRMMPKNQRTRDQLHKLKIYKGSAHPHEAQSPKPLP